MPRKSKAPQKTLRHYMRRRNSHQRGPEKFFLDTSCYDPCATESPVNQGNCNFDAESVPVPRLDPRTDAHAAARRTTTPGSAPAPATPTLLANEPGLDPRLSFPIVIGNIIGPVASISINLAGIILLAAAISRLDGVTFPELV